MDELRDRHTEQSNSEREKTQICKTLGLKSLFGKSSAWAFRTISIDFTLLLGMSQTLISLHVLKLFVENWTF